MKHRLLAAMIAAIGSAFAFAAPALAVVPDVPVPNVTGPVAVTGDSYPFLATDQDLDKYGYVEKEYFIEGDGYTYDTSGPYTQDATRNDGDGPYPFKTRLVVRRPANPADANGAVVAEWNNVTLTQDIEWNWLGDPEFMLKNGYTFVGVTAQNLGVSSLLAFDATRYAGLTVNGNGALANDDLSYDVFGAAVNAIKGNRTGVDPLGGITPGTVIASGQSQSCGRLATHHNEVNPLQGIADAYLLTVCDSLVRDDRPEKLIRVLTESENRFPRPVSDYPDTASIRHWEVAGASHLSLPAGLNAAPILNRDFLRITVQCEKPPLSPVQVPFTVNRAIKGLVDWVEDGTVPPIAPRGQYDVDDELIRDADGIAAGGIRYPEITVPTAVNDGVNDAFMGMKPPPEPGTVDVSFFCRLLGSSTPFTDEQLAPLYTDFADYVSQYSQATDEFLKTGFILPEDAERLKAISRQFPGLRPTAPTATGKKKTRNNVGLTWVGTEAPDSTFLVERKSKKGGWKTASEAEGADLVLKKQPQGTHSYRVKSTTVFPANNFFEEIVRTTPFSEELKNIKVDRSGPKKPKIKVKGKRIGRNTYRGKVRVKVVGKPDAKLPDGSNGVGLKNKSVPKVKKIRKKGKTVIKVRTRDKLGNKSKTAKVVIKIR